MSETIQKSWITDENGQKIAPKTLIEQVQDNDGTPLQNYVDRMIITDEEDSTTIPEVSNDISNDIVQFTSNDCGPDGDPALWEIPKMTTGEKISSLMQKISRIANNFRYILNLLGNTDISSIGDGTLTGIVKTLNDNLDEQIRTHSGSYTSILSIVKDIPSDKNRIYNITSDFTDYPPIMVNMGYIVYPVIEVVSKGSVRYITLTACDANGYSKKIIGYTTLDLSSILWKFDTNIIDVLHLQATNSTSSPSVFTVNLPEKYQNISTVTLYAIAQPGYGWGSLAVTNAGISNKVIYIATNYSGSVISPFFNIILSY